MRPRAGHERSASEYTGMPLYIRSPEAELLARKLAAQTGETLTAAVIVALRERLGRTRPNSSDERLKRSLKIVARASRKLAGKRVSTDDLYDRGGLPR